MKRNHLFAWTLGMTILLPVLVACGGAPPATSSATTAPAPAATTAPAPAATTAPAPAASASIGDMPQNLRTDLKGQTIKFIGHAAGPSSDFEKKYAAVFEQTTGIKVEVLQGPQSATERIAQYLQQLGAQSSDVDVYMIDVIWPGILANHAVDLTNALQSQHTDYFERIVKNNTVDGKLVGIPMYVGAGLLFYRTDLLKKYGFDKPPATWAELEQMAQKIQDGERAAGKPDFWGYVWQGAAYEGLTCDALEWQFSEGGGTIIEPDGTISINNANAIKAFERAKGWISTISPPGVTTYKEEEARGVWQAGNAAFMRNWGYAYALGQAADSPIKDKFDVTILPKGDGANGQPAATLGGWQIMVSKYSKHQEAAIEWAKFLTSPEIQKKRVLENSLEPTIASLYQDPDILKALPYYGRYLPVFRDGAVARPSTVSADLYNDVSAAYFTGVNQVLTGKIDSKTAVADLETKLKGILK